MGVFYIAPEQCTPADANIDILSTQVPFLSEATITIDIVPIFLNVTLKCQKTTITFYGQMPALFSTKILLENLFHLVCRFEFA